MTNEHGERVDRLGRPASPAGDGPALGDLVSTEPRTRPQDMTPAAWCEACRVWTNSHDERRHTEFNAREDARIEAMVRERYPQYVRLLDQPRARPFVDALFGKAECE